MKKRREALPAGFTLMELLIAMSLSTLVIAAVVAFATSMIRTQFQEIRRGEVSGATILSLDQLRTDLENATYLQFPSAAAVSNVLSGCANYSMALNTPGPLLAGAPVTSFYYCVDATSHTLWRYQASGICPYAPAPAPCGAGSATAIVYGAFYPSLANPGFFFKRTADTSGVELFYSIGNPSATATLQSPINYQFDTKINMVKAYMNTTD